MATWDIYKETADGNEDPQFLAQWEAVTESEALHQAAQFYEISEHDLVAREPITSEEMAIHQAQLDAPKARRRKQYINMGYIWNYAMEMSLRSNIPSQFGQAYMQAFVDEYKKPN